MPPHKPGRQGLPAECLRHPAAAASTPRSIRPRPTRVASTSSVPWRPCCSRRAYELLASAADCIQFDDPMLGYFVDPKYREQRSGHWGTGQFADVERRAACWASTAPTACAAPLRQRGAYVVLHVCRGNIERRSDAQGDFGPIWPALCRAEVDELALEFAMPEAGEDRRAGRAAGATAAGLRLRRRRCCGAGDAGDDRGASGGARPSPARSG